LNYSMDMVPTNQKFKLNFKRMLAYGAAEATMQNFKDFLGITIAGLLQAIAICFFNFPNKFSAGGTSGIAIFLSAIFPSVSPGIFMVILSMFFILLGFAFFGNTYGIKTVYASIFTSITIYMLERAFPIASPLTKQPLAELIFAVMLSGLGTALFYYCNSSSGGTDTLARIIKKYTDLGIGKGMFFIGVFSTVANGILFGAETFILSILGLLAGTLVIDNVIGNLNLSKYFTIITDYPSEICSYINQTLHRGATLCNCKGMFTEYDKKMILTVVNPSQATALKRYIKKIDSRAFVIITNSSSIMGKGFKV